MVKAVATIETGQLTGIEERLRATERDLQTTPAVKGQQELLGILYVIQCNTASLLGDTAWIIEASQQVTRLVPAENEAMVEALAQRGVAHSYEGDYNQVNAVWEEALLSQANHFTFYTASIMDALGRIATHQGQLVRAAELFERCLQLLAQEEGHYLRWPDATQRDYGDLLRERNQLDEARELVSSGLELCQKWEGLSGQSSHGEHLSQARRRQSYRSGGARQAARYPSLAPSCPSPRRVYVSASACTRRAGE